MRQDQSRLVELIRLYEDDRLSVSEVARRFEVSRQAVHERLRRAGVRMRPTQTASQKRPPRFEREVMVDLYERQRLTVRQVAERLGLTDGIVTHELKKHAIPRREPSQWVRKYPELSRLKIGESLLVPRPSHRRPYSNFYGQAKNAGIKISIRSTGEAGFELIRVG